MKIQRQRKIYMSDAEWEKLSILAKSSGRSNSEYLRSLLNLKIPKPIPSKYYYKLYREIAAIGNNINQMAKLCHLEHKHVDYDKFCNDIDILNDMKRLLLELQLPENLRNGNSTDIFR